MWKPFGSERVKESQKLLKSEKKSFYHTFLSFWASLKWKNLFSVRSEIWLPATSILIVIGTICRYQFNRNFLKTKCIFQISVAFSKSTLNFEHFEEIMSFIAQVFLKLLSLKEIHKRSCLWKPFGSEPVNESQELLKSKRKYFCPTVGSCSASLRWKKNFSVKSEILGLLVDRLTANYMYSRSNRDNLLLPAEM